MSNSRWSLATSAAYDLKARHALGRSVEAMEKELPPAPAAWRDWGEAVLGALAWETSLSSNTTALRQLREALFVAPGRESDMAQLWRESLATAAFAAAFATLRGLDAPPIAVSGLLYRCGEAGVRRALALAESASGIELDARARTQVAGRYAATFAEELVRAWQLPADVAVAVCGWNRFGEFPTETACMAVYLGQLLGEELLRPQSGTPGAVEAAAEDLGIPASELITLRASAPAAEQLLQRLG